MRRDLALSQGRKLRVHRLPVEARTGRPGRPSAMTPGQAWRFRRNLVIAVAHRAGLSQRLLADVFDLPRSRIAAIVAEVRALADPSAAG